MEDKVTREDYEYVKMFVENHFEQTKDGSVVTSDMPKLSQFLGDTEIMKKIYRGKE